MKKTLLLILLLVAVGARAQHWRDTAAYRLNKLQPHDCIIPEGDWQRPLGGLWAVRGADLVCLPMNRPLTDSVFVLQRHFTLPPHWQGRRTVVSFAAAGPALYLYVNGRQVGYSEDSKTPAEWDITRYLNGGTNRMEVRLLRRPTGRHLEDAYPAAGITRDITLYSLPATYISDIRIDATLDTADYRTGRLDVMVDLSREVSGGTVEVEILGRTVRKALRSGDWFVSLEPQVGLVEPWSDSTPALYPLTIRLLDAAGRETHRLVKHIGFRRLDIRRGQLLLNGRPVELRGLNRLEQSPLGGQHVPRSEMRRTAVMLKQLGFNAVRTLNHPPDDYWVHLCDSLGIFLWPQANICPSDPAVLDDGRWLNPVLDRTFNLYRRYRNHPSVVAWCLASDGLAGRCLDEAYRFLRTKDNSRPIVLPSHWAPRATDLASPPNPSPSLLRRYLKNIPPHMPCIPAMVAPTAGTLADFWALVRSEPRLQGAFLSGFQIDEIVPVFNAAGSPGDKSP